VAVTRETDDGELEILLAKKPGEKGYRLIGGFVSPTNGSLEGAARQEVLKKRISKSPRSKTSAAI